MRILTGAAAVCASAVPHASTAATSATTPGRKPMSIHESSCELVGCPIDGGLQAPRVASSAISRSGECRRSARAWQLRRLRSMLTDSRLATRRARRCGTNWRRAPARLSPRSSARRTPMNKPVELPLPVHRPPEDDAVRGVRRNAGRARRHGRVRHRRLGVHGRARPLPARRHPLHLGRARAGRRPHGRRLRARVRAGTACASRRTAPASPTSSRRSRRRTGRTRRSSSSRPRPAA